MASNHTEHLKLCQWEAEDKVLRADFNADNAKIDRAVAELGQRVDEAAVDRELLVSQTPEEGTNLVRLPLTGLDRNKWRRLVLYAQAYSTSTYADVYLNNSRRSGSVVNLYTGGGTGDVLCKVYCCPVGGTSITRVEFDLTAPLVICRHYSLASSSGSTSAIGSSGISIDRVRSWSGVTELTISGAAFQAGSSFQVWVER